MVKSIAERARGGPSVRRSFNPGRAAGSSGLRRRGQAPARGSAPVTAGPSSERAVILAPKGRDASRRRGLDPRGGLSRASLRRSPRAAERDRGRRRSRRDRRRGDQDRGSAWPRELAQWPTAMVGFSDRAADASGRRSGAQSGCCAARAGARQRHLPGAAVSSDHAGEHRRLRDSRQAPSVSRPGPSWPI